MKIIKNPTIHGGWECPICKKSECKPTTLIPINGTTDGSVMKALMVHVDCIDLYYEPGICALYQLGIYNPNDGGCCGV